MTPSRFCGTIQPYEARRPRRASLSRRCAVAAAAAQAARRRAPQPPRRRADKVAEAYAQFLLGASSRGRRRRRRRDRRLQARDRRSIRAAADIAAELAGAVPAAEPRRRGDRGGRAGAEDRAGQSRSAPRARHRLRRAVGERTATAHAAARAAQADENLAKAIQHLEQALDRPVGESDPNLRATLARLYVAQRRVRQGDSAAGRSRQPGARLAGRPDAARRRRTPAPGGPPTRSRWLEERAPDDPRAAADARRFLRARAALDAMRPSAYAQALEASPRNVDLQDALRVGAAERRRPRRRSAKARDVLQRGRRGAADRRARAVSAVAGGAAARRSRRRPKRRRAASSRRTARARGATTRSPRRSRSAGSIRRSSTRWRRPSPSSAARRPTPRSTLGMLLPHLGFAYQELGQLRQGDRAFEEARKLAPNDRVDRRLPDRRRNIAAKKYARGGRARAQGARASIPTTCGSRGSRRRRCVRAARPIRASRCSKTCVQEARRRPDGVRRAGAGLLGRQSRRRRR